MPTIKEIDSVFHRTLAADATTSPRTLYEVWAPVGRLDEAQLARIVRLGNTDWEWEREALDGRVIVGGPSQVTIEASQLPEAVRQELEHGWARELREQGYWGHWEPGQKLTRYLTRSYVALEEPEAQRLAKIDNTPWGDVKVAEGVELLHCGSGSWAYWSDGITTSIGLPKHARRAATLSKDAAGLISVAYGADSRSPKAIGGYKFLARVAKILKEETVAKAPHSGVYASRELRRFDLEMLDGSETSIWVNTQGYFEGYAWEAYPSLEAWQADFEAEQKLYAERERELENAEDRGDFD